MVTLECYEKLIKSDMLHPLTNQKLKEKDIIFMERVSTWRNFSLLVIVTHDSCFHFQGGTGYSTTNESLEGKEKRPALQV